MALAYAAKELAAILGGEWIRPCAERPVLRGVSTDTRTLQAGEAFFALAGPNFDGGRFVDEAFAKGASIAVVRRDASYGAQASGPCMKVDDPLRALQAFAAHHRRRFAIPVLALTGSCGKTTSKELIAAVLSTRYRVMKTPGNLNNDIGCPLSLLRIDDDTQAAVIEMGANHPGEIAQLCSWTAPTESAITLIAPAHLEGFGDIEGVAKAKAEIVEALGADGCFYVNMDDARCRAIAERFSGENVRYGGVRTEGPAARGEYAIALERFEPLGPGEAAVRIHPVGELRLPLLSLAHVSNVLLAVAVGLRHGVTDMEEALRGGLAGASRGALVQIGPLTVIDDTYNANPASMAAALDALSRLASAGGRIAALGDMLELGESSAALHRELGRRAAQAGVDRLFVRGDMATETAAGAREAGLEAVEVIEAHEAMAEAIALAAKPGGALLVKGSRGMRMERVLAALRMRLERRDLA